MARLAPPIVEGTIPAFWGTEINVPFAMNRSVSTEQVAQIVLKIKTIASSTYLGTFDGIFNQKTMTASFALDEIKKDLHPGQFYKIQLAFKDYALDSNGNKIAGEIGYYSAVSVVKYTSKPTVIIEGLQTNLINNHTLSYIGSYSQDGENADTTEKEYKYNFTIYDSNKNIYMTSGEQLHNSINDTEYNKSSDVFDCEYELQPGQTYYIQYTITTINNLVISSPRYRLQQKVSIEPNLNADIDLKLNFDNGYISISLIPYIENGAPISSNGAFLLSRACIDTNYTKWDNLTRFRFNNETAQGVIFKDFTIEQGKTYKYGISQFNDAGLYSNRRLSKEIYSDFEDSFLYDGERQLKIRFNPQVSSFKTDILEQKTDTIGSQYPFVFRNGRVNYKEFPISGLVSYQMDEEQLFMTDEEMLLLTDNQNREDSPSKFIDTIRTRTTNLSAYNFMAEREFKLRVLDWINNGKIKLFRSPAEGDYLVRLMGTTLSPNNTVSRLIHSFNSQAYEMAECNYKNLLTNGIIKESIVNPVVLKWKTVNINKELLGVVVPIEFDGQKYIKLNKDAITTFQIDGLIPGTVLLLENNKGIQQITIGATGAYYIDDAVDIVAVYAKENDLKRNFGINIFYSYYSTVSNSFEDIDEVNASVVPTRQFFNSEEIIEALNNVYYYTDIGVAGVEPIPNIKEQISLLNYVSFTLKEGVGQKLYMVKLGKDSNQYNYYTKALTEAQAAKYGQKYIFNFDDMNPYYSYPVYNTEKEPKLIGYLCRGFHKEDDKTVYGVYLNRSQKFDNENNEIDENNPISNPSYTANCIEITTNHNDEPFKETRQIMDLTDTGSFTTKFLTDMPKKIRIGANVRADITYTSNTIVYQIERNNDAVKKSKQNWENERQAYQNYLKNIDVENFSIEQQKELEQYRINNLNAYYMYIKDLTQALAEKEE